MSMVLAFTGVCFATEAAAPVKKEKKKWKQLAQERGRVLHDVFALTAKAVSTASDADDEF